MKREYGKYLLVFVFCLFVFPLITRAECSYQRQAELSKIASNVQISYNYDLTVGYPAFSVNISNVTDDIYVLDDFWNTITFDMVLNYGLIDGVNYTIYSNDINCKGEKIVSKTVKFPVFNDYSQRDECKNNAELNVCSVWGNYYRVSESEFKNIIAKNETSKREYAASRNANSFIIKAANFIRTYWVLFAVCAFGGLTIYIVLGLRRNKNEKK